MLQLNENEKIIIVIHRHWFVVARMATLLVILLLIPPAAYALVPFLESLADLEVAVPLINFGMALYSMALILFLFLFWMDYYLDMWIVTDRRLIDVEQIGLFHREISEIPLSRVQDVTLQIHGVIETVLRFGTIRIQTAGEREFFIRDAPHLYKIKDAILKQIHGGA